MFHTRSEPYTVRTDTVIVNKDPESPAPTCTAVRMENGRAVPCGGPLEYVSEVGDG